MWSYNFYDPCAILNVLVKCDRKIVRSYDSDCDFDNYVYMVVYVTCVQQYFPYNWDSKSNLSHTHIII